MLMTQATSPLLWKTPPEWAAQALADIHALLSDHAYLERKAASNALELLNRWPDPIRPPRWEQILAQIARDESRHLEQVLRHLAKRGGKLERKHKSTYAQDLRGLVRMGKGPHEILDRLLVNALIEARSCERFDLLAQACLDKDLASFYKSLWASEADHFEVFLSLGKEILALNEVNERWEEMLTREAAIIQRQPPGSQIHSGLRSSN